MRLTIKDCIKLTIIFLLLLADDESETSPHDLEGNNSDLEYGNDDTFQFKGNSSFTQMQVRIKLKFLDQVQVKVPSKVLILKNSLKKIICSQSLKFIADKNIHKVQNTRLNY